MNLNFLIIDNINIIIKIEGDYMNDKNYLIQNGVDVYTQQVPTSKRKKL